MKKQPDEYDAERSERAHMNALDGLDPEAVKELVEAAERIISNETIATIDHGEGDYEYAEVDYGDFYKLKSALDKLKGGEA